MITLYGFGAGFGLPEISPFVTKTEVQLKMAGLAYAKEKAMPPSSPKGQMPYIVDEAETIADSTFIRAHIEGKYGFDFDAPMNLQQRAQAWAFERMIEHHVYWALVGARWVDPVNFAKGPAHFFDAVPEIKREKVREDAQFRVAIIAPARGLIATVLVEPGQMVTAGTPLATLIPADAASMFLFALTAFGCVPTPGHFTTALSFSSTTVPAPSSCDMISIVCMFFVAP